MRDSWPVRCDARHEVPLTEFHNLRPPLAQLETLQATLQVENRIKDGAENLLSMDLEVGLLF